MFPFFIWIWNDNSQWVKFFGRWQWLTNVCQLHCCLAESSTCYSCLHHTNQMTYNERPINTQQEIHFRIKLQSAKWGLTMMHHRPSSDLQNYGFRGGSTGLQQIWNCFETMTVFPSGQTCQLWLQQTRKLFTIPSFIQFQHTVVRFFTGLQSHGVIH